MAPVASIRSHSALYIHPVLCVVYRLRSPTGQRLDPEVVKRHPAPGILKFDFKPGGTSERWAHLLDERTGVAKDELRAAEVMKVSRGIMIGGWEQHPGRPHTRQVWWCLPGPLDDMTTI